VQDEVDERATADPPTAVVVDLAPQQQPAALVDLEAPGEAATGTSRLDDGGRPAGAASGPRDPQAVGACQQGDGLLVERHGGCGRRTADDGAAARTVHDLEQVGPARARPLGRDRLGAAVAERLTGTGGPVEQGPGGRLGGRSGRGPRRAGRQQQAEHRQGEQEAVRRTGRTGQPHRVRLTLPSTRDARTGTGSTSSSAAGAGWATGWRTVRRPGRTTPAGCCRRPW
jgi:hypothetical protein